MDAIGPIIIGLVLLYAVIDTRKSLTKISDEIRALRAAIETHKAQS